MRAIGIAGGSWGEKLRFCARNGKLRGRGVFWMRFTRMSDGPRPVEKTSFARHRPVVAHCGVKSAAKVFCRRDAPFRRGRRPAKPASAFLVACAVIQQGGDVGFAVMLKS